MSNTTVNNRIIAKFRGAEICGDSVKLPTHPAYYIEGEEPFFTRDEDLFYDKRWDWLMPVVQQIKKLEVAHLDSSYHFGKVLLLPVTATIEEVYEAVVTFIKWYNNANDATVKRLLTPRIKVCASHPHSKMKDGDILVWSYAKEAYIDSEGLYEITQAEVKEYPNLFQEMLWWHSRNVEDMPRYVKRMDKGDIKQVWEVEYEIGKQNGLRVREVGGDDKFEKYPYHERIIPATEEEYLTFKK